MYCYGTRQRIFPTPLKLFRAPSILKINGNGVPKSNLRAVITTQKKASPETQRHRNSPSLRNTKYYWKSQLEIGPGIFMCFRMDGEGSTLELTCLTNPEINFDITREDTRNFTLQLDDKTMSGVLLRGETNGNCKIEWSDRKGNKDIWNQISPRRAKTMKQNARFQREEDKAASTTPKKEPAPEEEEEEEEVPTTPLTVDLNGDATEVTEAEDTGSRQVVEALTKLEHTYQLELAKVKEQVKSCKDKSAEHTARILCIEQFFENLPTDLRFSTPDLKFLTSGNNKSRFSLEHLETHLKNVEERLAKCEGASDRRLKPSLASGETMFSKLSNINGFNNELNSILRSWKDQEALIKSNLKFTVVKYKTTPDFQDAISQTPSLKDTFELLSAKLLSII